MGDFLSQPETEAMESMLSEIEGSPWETLEAKAKAETRQTARKANVEASAPGCSSVEETEGSAMDSKVMGRAGKRYR